MWTTISLWVIGIGILLTFWSESKDYS